MEAEKKSVEILKLIQEKSVMKQAIFDNLFATFTLLKKVLKDIEIEFNSNLINSDKRVWLKFSSHNNFQCELKIAGDVLIFMMHTNVFDFDREHAIRKMPHIKTVPNATYAGIISIYNFLSDSFRYSRYEDIGYLVGRIFVNKDKHFFVEGKRQTEFLYNTLGKEIISYNALRTIVESTILYTLQFDLLVTPYEQLKSLNVSQIIERQRQNSIQTGKRLGFTFNADDVSDIH